MAAVSPEDPAEEPVELVRGLGVILMSIDARLERMLELLGGDDAEEDQH